ncbi:MAG: MBL fold metallo-hydrolase [Reyranellaceae bacterium]
METRIDEVQDGIFRLSTYVPRGDTGITFNQFLIVADQPMLFHCGQRFLFDGMVQAMRKVIDPASLRWIGFSHGEADESGSMNEWLALAPQATVAHSRLGCSLAVQDHAIRQPRIVANGETIDLGGKTVRFIETPHVPHNWEACLLLEETTGTFFTSDLFTAFGKCDVESDGGDILAPAIATEEEAGFTSLGPNTGRTIRKLASLMPRHLALMHGPMWHGDGARMLDDLAGYYDERLRREMAA